MPLHPNPGRTSGSGAYPKAGGFTGGRKKTLAADINTFATALFMYRKTIASLSGNCIVPLIMNAFFTASISAWADYCEYIGRQNTYEALVQTTEYIKNGDSDSAICLFTECIEKYKNHLRNL